MRRRSFLGGVALCAVQLPAVAASSGTTSERIGHAYSIETGQLVYIERHRENRRGTEILRDDVAYTDSAGRLIASKSVDFETGRLTPDFLLENTHNGHTEGVVSTGGMREVIFRENDTASLIRKPIDVFESGIIDAGFDQFIVLYWQRLVAGESLVRPFLVPSRQSFVDFRIRRSADRETNGTHVFTLEIESPWIRWLVQPIFTTYQRTIRSLTRYEGLSNMRDNDGNNYPVRIDFNDAPDT